MASSTYLAPCLSHTEKEKVPLSTVLSTNGQRCPTPLLVRNATLQRRTIRMLLLLICSYGLLVPSMDNSRVETQTVTSANKLLIKRLLRFITSEPKKKKNNPDETNCKDYDAGSENRSESSMSTCKLLDGTASDQYAC